MIDTDYYRRKSKAVTYRGPAYCNKCKVLGLRLLKLTDEEGIVIWKKQKLKFAEKDYNK